MTQGVSSLLTNIPLSLTLIQRGKEICCSLKSSVVYLSEGGVAPDTAFARFPPALQRHLCSKAEELL